MLLNIVLLFLVFGATKKKMNPYAAAAILGAVKGVLYFVGTGSVVAAVLGFSLFGAMAAGLVYFLACLDKKEASEEPYPTYGTRKKGAFKWEYIPLSVIVLFLIGGEMVINLTLS